MKNPFSIAIAAVLIAPALAIGADSKPGARRSLIAMLGKAVVQIRIETPQGRAPHGTAFLVDGGYADGTPNRTRSIYLVSNRHVLASPGRLHVMVPFKADDGQLLSAELDLSKQLELSKAKIITHDDPTIDLALLPLPLDDHAMSQLVAIPVQTISDDKEIDALVAAQIFFLGFPVSLVDVHRPRALYRFGVISGQKADGKLLIDAQNFGGSSGSPVFLFPTQLQENGISVGGAPRLIGIMSAFEPAMLRGIPVPTAETKFVPIENSGIARAEWANDLKAIILKAEQDGRYGKALKNLVKANVKIDSLYSKVLD